MIRYISLLLAIISGQHTTFSESLKLFKRQCHIRDATWDTVLHYLLSDSMFSSGGPALQQGVGWANVSVPVCSWPCLDGLWALRPCHLQPLPVHFWADGNQSRCYHRREPLQRRRENIRQKLSCYSELDVQGLQFEYWAVFLTDLPAKPLHGCPTRTAEFMHTLLHCYPTSIPGLHCIFH